MNLHSSSKTDDKSPTDIIPNGGRKVKTVVNVVKSTQSGIVFSLRECLNFHLHWFKKKYICIQTCML